MSNPTYASTACTPPSTAARLETRGTLWLIGSFLVCPCHLPLTLALAGLLLGGTTAGTLLGSHPLAAGVLVTAVWVAGTWRGFHPLRAARRFADRQMSCCSRPPLCERDAQGRMP